jgi:isoleucyl-tRNA synthetase
MYQPVPDKPDFPSIERRVLDFWEETRAFDTLRQQLADSAKRFSFIDGPITANNPMGVHHAWGRTYKDLYQRYKAMNGFNQRWQNGFDCQGLWVEVEVEKELGFSTKRDIESYGIAEFVQRCKDRVMKFARVISEQSIRLGQWMDWGDSYFTMSEENNYTIWRVIKTCHERGWLYRGHDVMPWCPRCGTGISHMEIETEGYKEVTHTSLYVRLPLLDRPNESLLVWTTTPWTLTSNVAAAVHPELTYARAVKDGQSVWLAEPLVKKLLGDSWQVEQHLRGADMLEWRYSGPFDELPAAQGTDHHVIPWTEVSQDEGTGIVHIAPGCGEEDFLLGQEFKLRVIAPIDDNGDYVQGFDWLTGQNVNQVARPIADNLRQKGVLFRTEQTVHRYPHCWRCGTELVFRLVDEWYIRMDELRHMIMEVTRQIRWLPDFGLERELDWLRNMRDWMISKKRYWGLALPIWFCEDCQRFEVVGGQAELRERAVAGLDVFEGHTPHRPYIDAVKLACSQCGKPISRIPDVGNPWLDAGIVPFSTLHYRTNPDYWRTWFPADFITESFPGQYRNWFYSLLVMSTVLENRPPFATVLGHGTVRGEDGRPMHKSLGNSIDFLDAAENAGADVMRWIFAIQNPAANVNFGFRVADETKRRLRKLWDSYRFFTLYADWTPSSAAPAVAERSELDRWLLSQINTLVANVREALDDFDAMVASRAIEEFFDGLSNWYIRLSRQRFWNPGGKADPAAAATLHDALVTLTKLIAPFLPFLSEEIYQNLVRGVEAEAPVSVHHCAYPEVDESLRDPELERVMDLTRLVASLGNAARKGASIRGQQPLRSVRVAGGSTFSELPDWAGALIRDELNVKSVEYARELAEAVRQRAEGNPKLLGPKYGREYNRIRAALQSGRFTVAADGTVRVEEFVLQADEVKLSLEPAPGYAAAADRGVLVVLDTELTPELVTEGRARAAVRLIQDARKQAGFEVSDRISVRYTASDGVAEAFERHAAYISRETLATNLESGAPGASGDGWHLAEDQIDGLPVTVAVRRESRL